MKETALEDVIESSKSLGKTMRQGELSRRYFEVIKGLSNPTKDELLKCDFFNKLFNENEVL